MMIRRAATPCDGQHRAPGEYSTGHIPAAVNIPVDIIAKEPPTTDTSALIIVYCRSGMRSASAKALLDEIGYLRDVNSGGISRWTGDLEK